MYQYKYVFAQLIAFLDRNHFNYLVRKYAGDKYVKHFTCWNQLLTLMFGQLSNRESLKDDMEFIFSNTDPEMKAGQAYLIVVNEGELTLEANNRSSVVTEPAEGDDIYAWGSDKPSLGKWRGSFEKIGNAEASAMLAYSLQESGDFRRIRPDGRLSSAAFRAMFCPNELTETNTYKSVFKQFVQGEDDPIINFPADLYVADTDIPDDPTAIKPIIHIIEKDGTSRYYDLQGRQLSGKPNKGIYIYKGKKAVSK